MFCKKILSVFFLMMFSVLFLTSCETVPITGRTQMAFIPDSYLLSMSNDNYTSFMNDNKVSSDPKGTKMVKSAGINIQYAVERYFADNNMSDKLSGYKWEYNIVEDTTVNAWCMPGGKVVFYSGILPYTKDETGIAVVMGHEIAHAVANHGNERMSQGLLVNMGGMAIEQALKEKPAETKNLFLKSYGAGAQVGLLLPYSRENEYEADHLGLIFMAMAGYDPNAAVEFWERMSKIGGQKPMELMSTHPSDEKRIANLKKLLPEAMKYYKKK